MHRSNIYKWLAASREGGMEALKAKSISGRPPKLSGAQIKWVYDTVVEETPLQMNFEFALWTRGMVREMIRKRYNVKLSEVSVGRLLKKLGLSPQKPLRRAYEQDPQLVKIWLEQEYPRIRAEAKKQGAEIYFADEASVRSDYHVGTTWGVKGKTPIVHTTGQRYRLNMLSAISPRGRLRFMVTEDSLTAGLFCAFLKRLLHNAHSPVFLIVDRHPVHRSRTVRNYIASLNGKLQLFYLPPYSPELNPDELVWNNVKSNAVGKRAVEDRFQFKALVISRLKSLQHLTVKIKAFFRESHVAYAAY
jgi:transposase